MDLLVVSITIFVLAIFVGFEVITKVPPTLHTPLMSGSNAISGITVIGAILSAGMLLEHIGQPKAAERVRIAVMETIKAGIMTPDLGGNAKTKEVTKRIIDNL